MGTAVAALAALEAWYAQQVLRQAGCYARPCRQLPSAALKRWGCISIWRVPLSILSQKSSTPPREGQMLSGDLTQPARCLGKPGAGGAANSVWGRRNTE